MTIFKKYFSRLINGAPNNDLEADQNINNFTAKEKQSVFIKTCLKPTLKQHEYLTNAQTWWRDRGDFFIIINLQNFSWNTRDDVNFCFNIGIGLKSLMKDSSKKPTQFNLTVHVREDAYLPDSRKIRTHKNQNGYIINQSTDIDNFIAELKRDFESEILPRLEKLKTIDDCVDYYKQFPFWGDRLKELIKAP